MADITTMSGEEKEALERLEDALDCGGALREDHELATVTCGGLRVLLDRLRRLSSPADKPSADLSAAIKAGWDYLAKSREVTLYEGHPNVVIRDLLDAVSASPSPAVGGWRKEDNGPPGVSPAATRIERAATEEGDQTHLDFRKVGFTGDAINYPLSERAFEWLCNFNGVHPDKAPWQWRYAPNAYMQKALDDHAASVMAPLGASTLGDSGMNNPSPAPSQGEG